MNDSNKIRILILSHYYPPETGGASARLSGLAKWLAKSGNEVSVITGYPNYPMGKIFNDYKKSNIKYEIIDDVMIHRVKVLPGTYNSILFRLLNYFTLLVSSFWIGIKKKNRFDIIIASSPPLTIGILGRILSSIYKVPWIFDIRDIWPDVGVEAGIIKEKSIINRLSSRLAKYLYNRADWITPVTSSKKTKIIGYGIPENKISIVENGIDSDLIENSTKKDWRSELNLENKFLLTYAGLIGRAQGVNTIIETAELLKERSDIHFLIVGEGVNKNTLIDRTQELQLTNVTFIDLQPKELIPSLLDTSDIGIIPLVNNNLKDAIPSKLLEAWSCRLPTILIAGGEAAEIVTNIDGGVALNSNDPELVKKLILELNEKPKTLKNYGLNGYNYVMKNLDRKYLAQKMEKIIHKVLNR